MEYLLAVIVGLVGLLYYSNTKRKSAEALNENLETKEKIQEIDKQAILDLTGLLFEEKKRQDANSELKEKLDDKPSQEELEEFFNKS